MIIIEGADNSGKSTLVKQISEALNILSIHPGGPPIHELDLLLKLSEQLTLSYSILTNSVIHDRITCISEAVYKNKINDPVLLTFTQGMIMCNSNIFIYCKPPYDILMDVQNHEVKEHDTIEQVELVKAHQKTFIENYESIMGYINHTTYDYTSDSVESLIGMIKRRIYGRGSG